MSSDDLWTSSTLTGREAKTPRDAGLRNPENFKGKCARCEYVRICGGSRARAFAWTGDAMEADPLCPFIPPAGDEVAH